MDEILGLVKELTVYQWSWIIGLLLIGMAIYEATFRALMRDTPATPNDQTTDEPITWLPSAHYGSVEDLVANLTVNGYKHQATVDTLPVYDGDQPPATYVKQPDGSVTKV